MPYLHSLRCQEVLCYAVCWTQSEELNAKLNFDVSPPEQTGQIKQTKMCCDHVKPSACHSAAASPLSRFDIKCMWIG